MESKDEFMNDQGLLLDIGPFARIRRNHALEHAALQILAQKDPTLNLAGYSDMCGIWIIGQVATQDLQQAVDEAVARLRNGERALAIHPNCGTNFAISGLLAGIAAWLGLLGANDLRRKWERLPFIVTMVTLVLIFSRPLGPVLQERVTTDANLGKLQIVAIYTNGRDNFLTHRILTRQ
jgi:hypothetical protein